MFQILPKFVSSLYFLERDKVQKTRVSLKRSKLLVFLGR